MGLPVWQQYKCLLAFLESIGVDTAGKLTGRYENGSDLRQHVTWLFLFLFSVNVMDDGRLTPIGDLNLSGDLKPL